MKVEIKVPSVGESVKEAILAQWYKKDGETVIKDEPLFVLETDKVTLEVEAEADGVLRIRVREGETVAVGAILGTIETETKSASPPTEIVESPKPAAPENRVEPVKENWPAVEKSTEKPASEPSRLPRLLAPSVRRLVSQKGIDIEDVLATGPGGRVTKGDVLAYIEKRTDVSAKASSAPPATQAAPTEVTVRKPMTPIRRRIAERLLEAKHGTAMLTTFNEIDMSQLMAMRSRYKEIFKEKHEVGLGFMSFFVKASVQALGEMPAINAFIEGEDMLFHDYCHIGVAVGSPRGLIVPVIKNAENLGFADIEKAILDFVKKINENRLELSDMEGGTFTISNGGVFGSLMSTPILNTPQSAILGMHKIEKRPVVVNDEIVIRPMMYVAMSYDHRIVDGREAVTFLRRIKECVENPERIMMEV